jgi:spore coat polysaccharide biosynthesis protein SpsF
LEGSIEINMTEIGAIIAARMGSKRLYGKPLVKINGEPILTHLLRALQRSKLIEKYIIATSDKKENTIFVDYAIKHNINYYVDKGYNEEDVLGRLIRAAKLYDIDPIIRITSEAPIIYNNTDEVITTHINKNADLTYTTKLPTGTAIEVLNLKTLEYIYNKDEKYHCAAVTAYIAKHPKEFNIVKIKPPRKVRKPNIGLDVDTIMNRCAIEEIFKYTIKDEYGCVLVENALKYIKKYIYLPLFLEYGRKKDEWRIFK